ncbi:MAG: TlpA disulfide reductase family protein, partial [Bacteroidota bacterium]
AFASYKDGDDFTFIHAKMIDSVITAQSIKNELLYTIGKYYLDGTKELDQVIAIINANLENKSHLAEISEIYESLKKLTRGMPSPTFTFESINGQQVTLKDFEGNLVYIDIWATWCLPCIKEFPDTKRLIEKFEGQKIAFVGISQDGNKSSWEKMVKKEQLGGTQVIADRDDTFFTDYQVSGIPRYILLDENGNIIDANAKRPSNPDLEMELSNLLYNLQ